MLRVTCAGANAVHAGVLAMFLYSSVQHTRTVYVQRVAPHDNAPQECGIHAVYRQQ